MLDTMENDGERPGWTRAREDLARAEKEVDAALSVLRSAPRAEKTGVTRAVEEAFDKVRAARLLLTELERKIDGDS